MRVPNSRSSQLNWFRMPKTDQFCFASWKKPLGRLLTALWCKLIVRYRARSIGTVRRLFLWCNRHFSGHFIRSRSNQVWSKQQAAHFLSVIHRDSSQPFWSSLSMTLWPETWKWKIHSKSFAFPWASAALECGTRRSEIEQGIVFDATNVSLVASTASDVTVGESDATAEVTEDDVVDSEATNTDSVVVSSSSSAASPSTVASSSCMKKSSRSDYVGINTATPRSKFRILAVQSIRVEIRGKYWSKKQ